MMVQFSKKLVGKSCLLLALSCSSSYASGDILDYYMMGILPSITANQYEPVIVPKTSSDPSVNMKSYHSTAVNFIRTYKKYDDSNTKLVKIASGNFAQTIDNYDMTSSDMQAFSNEWLSNLPRTAAALLYINYLNELQVKIPASSVQVGVVVVRPRIGFLGAVLLVGIAYGLEQGMEYMYDSIQDYNHIGENTISGATGAELEDINVHVLHIDRDATAQEALEEYNSLDFMTKARLVEHISESNAEAGDGQTEPERREGFSELSKKLGRAAVTTTVGLEVSAAGGQFVDKIAAASGMSVEAAAVVDLGLTVMGEQPLDYLLMATESGSKTNQTVPASSMSHQEAVETLDSARKREDVKIEKVIDATKKIVNETARLVPGAKILPNGSVEVPIPDKMDLRLIDKLPVGDTTVKVRDLEQFDILLQAEGMYPERFADINKTNIESLDIDSINLPECPIIYDPLLDDHPATADSIYLRLNDKDDDGAFEDYINCFYNVNNESYLKQETPYIDFKKDGLAIWYYNSGSILSITAYVADKKNGIAKYYYESGNLRSKKPYVNDVRNGLGKWYYDEPGHFKLNIPYLDGEIHGTAKYYYPSGGLYREQPYNIDGIGKWYYESGQIYREYPLAGGKTVGIYKTYYKSGQIYELKPYNSNGRVDGHWEFYSIDGRICSCTIFENGTYAGHCATDGASCPDPAPSIPYVDFDPLSWY